MSATVNVVERLARSSLVALDLAFRQVAPIGPRQHARAFRHLCRDLARIHRLELDVDGRFPDGPAVLVANHLGYLDPIAIGSLRACMPIAKREVGEWPVIGAQAESLGVAFVDRGEAMSGARVLLRALDALAAGVSVLNFPEGTTTHGDEVLPFRRGIFGVARLAGVPVVPVRLDFHDRAMCWVGDESFVPHYLRFLRRPTTRMRLRIGAPIERTDLDADALAQLARRKILEMR